MMLKLAFGLTLFSGSVALSAPFIDPQLAQLNATQSTRFRAILLFHDKAPVAYQTLGNRKYPAVRRAMEQNARLSQSNLAAQLTQESTLSTPVHFRSLWIANAMLIDAPKTMFAKLAKNPEIRAILANRKLRVIPSFFHGQILGQTGDRFTPGLQAIHIPEMRQAKPDLNGQGVNVGVLDTGIDANHRDLQGKMLVFRDFVAAKTTPYDDHGHGTHVAGTIAGGAASGTAIGVAPQAKLTIAKVFDSDGSGTTETILQAMQWVADPDGNPATKDQPLLVSNSWGDGSPNGSKDPNDEALCVAVGSWVKLGMMPVFAAGNDGPGKETVSLPGGCPAAFAVGATHADDRIASFSSRGSAIWKTGPTIKPNVSAPGVNVMSSMPGGKYGAMSGTSMATPHTAGLLALIYQAFPSVTIEQASALVVKGVKDLGPAGNDNDFGWGRIDAMGTLKAMTLQK